MGKKTYGSQLARGLLKKVRDEHGRTPPGMLIIGVVKELEAAGFSNAQAYQLLGAEAQHLGMLRWAPKAS